MERERREREARELSERSRLKRAAARHTMAFWNVALAAGWRTIFYPSVGTALTTGCHWLHVVCPACQQMGEVDLREIDIHQNASIGTVVRAMSCRRCSPHPPFARPLGATRRSWYGQDSWQRSRYGLPAEQFMADEELQRGHNYYMESENGPNWARTKLPRARSEMAVRRWVRPLASPAFRRSSDR
jgi:hypothetical protein